MTDLGEHVGNELRSNLPELQYTTFIVVIRWESNGNDIILSPEQLHASYTNVSHWDELIDFIHRNGAPKVPYILTSMLQYTLEQDELNE